jgi:tetratricopeptide (TPR) repeat protein
MRRVVEVSLRRGHAFWTILLTLSFALYASAQGQRSGQPPPQLPVYQHVPAMPEAIGPVAQTKDEAEAFKGVLNEQSPAKRIELAEAFVAKYPNSDFVQEAHTFRVYAYGQLGRTKETIGAAEQAIDATRKFREKLVAKAEADAKLTAAEKENIKKTEKDAIFLEKNSRSFTTFLRQSEQRALGLYQAIMQGYQQLNDSAKVTEWGEKALRFKPDDIRTLMMLSQVMAERPSTNEPEKAEQMKRAEELATRGLSLLPVFLATEATKIPEDLRGDLTARMHDTLGLIYFHQKKLGLSQQEFLTAIKSKPKDPAIYHRLGLAYIEDMKNDQAIEALGKSVFLKGASEAEARNVLKQLYVSKNKSEKGLDDFIKACGAKIEE